VFEGENQRWGQRKKLGVDEIAIRTFAFGQYSEKKRHVKERE
jgi:hypothetical protein